MTSSSCASSPRPIRATSSSREFPGEEATVKTFLRKRNKIVLRPANETMEDLVFDPSDVKIYGKVVTLLRRI